VPEYAYLILSFARPTKLISCIRSIRLNDPYVPIYICVDICDDQSSPFFIPNQELVALTKKLFQMGEISGFKITSYNLKTKAAANFALKWVFELSDYVVFIEDDLILERSPRSFIRDAIKVMANPTIGISTLYSRSTHVKRFGSSNIDFRLTRWPIMWGFILSKMNYERISKDLRGWSNNDFYDLANGYIKNSTSSILTKLFRNRFTSSWVFKFKNAHQSKTAWDTEWQSGLWRLNLLAVVPSQSFLIDTGTDESSVSQNKPSGISIPCPGDWEISVSNYFICNRCERRREHENSTIPKILTKVPFLGKRIKDGLI